jgi:hypothetical protein
LFRKAVATVAKRDNIKPVFFIVAFMVMVLIGLFAAVVTGLSVNVWKITASDSITNSVTGLYFMRIFFSVSLVVLVLIIPALLGTIKAALSSLSLFGLPVSPHPFFPFWGTAVFLDIIHYALLAPTFITICAIFALIKLTQ